MSASAGGLGGTASALLKSPQTALQLLLEEINFQRTKEMRQLLKDGKLSHAPSIIPVFPIPFWGKGGKMPIKTNLPQLGPSSRLGSKGAML